MKYKYIPNEQVVKFYEDRNGQLLTSEEWNLLQKDILSELCDNGCAVLSDNCVSVPTGNIYLLDEVERKLLGLPSEYPYDMYVETNNSTLTQDDFSYRVSFYTFYPGGSVMNCRVDGCFVMSEEGAYLLNKEQYELYEAIQEFNSLLICKRSKRNKFLHFAEIKDLSASAAAKLDSYLVDTDVCVPNKIKVLVDYKEDSLHLSASIDSPESKQFSERFDKKKEVRETYSLKENNGKRLHVVFNDQQIDQLKNIKRFDNISDRTEIDRIMESPESIFNADEIDIHEFYSDRVIEIGLYKPKYYSFICPYRSEWISGIKVNDNVNGTANLFFAKPQDLEELKEKASEADKLGKQSIEWKGILLNVNEVLSQVSSIGQLGYPIEHPQKEKCKLGEQVLIIEENAENLGYTENAAEVPNQPGHYDFYLCDSLNTDIELKNHQKEGVAWLQYLYSNKFKGCLLADDMGLGKTLQILYFMEWHRMQNVHMCRPYLVVAPVSLLENWQREYKRFFSDKRMESTILMTKDVKKDFDSEEVNRLQSKQLIITSYETLRNRQFNFCAVDYALVVLDEAQKAKTPGSMVTNSIKSLKADFKIAMTGTPVENTLVDLWCIMDFSVPGLLGNAREFSKQYQSPLKDNDTDIELLGKTLRSNLGEYFKRRMKSEVAKELPVKHIFMKKIEMSALQKQQYREELNAVKRVREEGLNAQGLMFKAIEAFRQICDCPYLSMTNCSEMDITELIDSSSKLRITVEILDAIRSRNEKVIIFTDHKDTQRMLRYIVKRKYGFTPHIINGDTPAAATAKSQKLSRQQTVDDFQSKDGFNVIIMSPIAAGTGLNVTEANNVIHYSRFWNPAKEQQATDRVYRIGQKKDVNVFYPMSVSNEFKTFDVIIDALLNRKMALADAALFPTVRTEVRQQELYDSLLEEKAGQENDYYIGPKDIDRMDDFRFEAFIAALYKKMGYKTILTPAKSDKGIDVIAMNGDVSYAIQVKHSANNVGIEGAYQAKSGCQYYSKKLGDRLMFRPVLITNSTAFTASTEDFANQVDLLLLGRDALLDMQSSCKVTFADVESCELHRWAKI